MSELREVGPDEDEDEVAEKGVSPAPAKPVVKASVLRLSSNLRNMKFMHRRVQAELLEQEAEAGAEKARASQWVIDERVDGYRVVNEDKKYRDDDEVALGRRSFRRFNPTVESLEREVLGRDDEEDAPKPVATQAVSVSATRMAQAFQVSGKTVFGKVKPLQSGRYHSKTTQRGGKRGKKEKQKGKGDADVKRKRPRE